MEARRSQVQVTSLSRDVIGALTTLSSLRFSDANWTACDDFGGKALYQVTGRLDPPARSVVPLVDEVAETMAASGMKLRRVNPQEDDPVTREVVRNGINIRFLGYPDQPHVLFDITGPCLDVDDLDRELIDRPPVPLRLDGT